MVLVSSVAPTSTIDPLPPSILGRVMRGTFWLGLKMPVQVVIALYSIPLTQRYIGEEANGAYVFAWGYGYIQFLLDFGMGSSLQRQMVDAYARRDRDAVNRTIACGMNFYTGVALIQVAFLLWLVNGGLPVNFRGNNLVIGVLWVQILATPFFGLSTVVGGVLQAAGRYDFIPRLEMAIVILRFGCLMVGYWTHAEFLTVVVVQIVIQIGLSLVPSLWVMVRDLGFVPHFGGARRADYASMMHISIYMALMQWSVVLADKVDTTVLGYALWVPGPDGAKAVKRLITVYQNVSKPFLQIRQTGWTLAYLVMPAAVSLIASGDKAGLDRVKFDGSRALIGLLTPPTLLAGIYAAPFLSLWVGARFAADAWMLQLFLVAIVPMAILVLCQIALGMGKIEVLAWASLGGALVNLPLSYVLTRSLASRG